MIQRGNLHLNAKAKKSFTMGEAKIKKTGMERTIISLETKIEILERLRNKERIVGIAEF